MSARGALAAYLAAVILVSATHAPLLLAAGLGGALAAAGRQRWHYLRRALRAILAFNLAISLGYVLVASWQDNFNAAYLLRINLRVLLLMFLSFWCVARVDVLAALAPWPTLRLLATLALGQMRVFERLLRDFRDAFVSRNPTPPRLADRAHHGAAQATTLLDKAMAASSEAALAMRSRGAFDD